MNRVNKIKVLHLLQSNQFSGAENVVCQIIGMFKNEGNIKMIYCSRDGQIRKALEERNIRFSPICDLNIKEVKRVIREQQPDIIHAHDMRASFVAALACGKIPLISHVHNNNFDSRGLSIKSIAYMFTAMKTKHIFWVSQSSFNGYVFHKLCAKKSTVLYNIIDIDSLYRRMDTDNHTYDYDVVYVGRLTYPKNPHRLLRVFEKIVAKLPSVKIGIVGTGDQDAETRELCNELELQKNVEFLGFQSNPLKMLHDAKVMIMTSRWEGTPMCALEAMALGVPIVSTPTDGLKDIIINGKNGFLSNDDEVLAKHILDIIEDKELRKRISEFSIQEAHRINDKENYIHKIKEQYEKAIRTIMLHHIGYLTRDQRNESH